MATRPETADHIVGQLQAAGDIRVRKMFGEYGLYCNEKIVALICDDQLFVKPTTISTQFLDDSHLAPPYPGAKNYYRVSPEKLADPAWLSTFIQATAAELPPPKPKKKR